MFWDYQDPASFAHQKANDALFKDVKLTEMATSKKRIDALTWDLTGTKIVTGSSDGIIRIYSPDQPSTLKKPQEIKGHAEQIEDLAWHPLKENVLVSTSKDRTIKIWDVSSKSPVQAQIVEKTKEENINLAISPDGNYLGVSNIKDELSFYDIRMSCKLIKQIKYKVDLNGFSWDKGEGNLLFVTDQNGNVSVFNGQTFANQPLHVMGDCHHGHCFAIAVDNGNRFFITGGNDSLIGIWDMSDFMLMKTISNNDYRVMTVNLSHEGRYIASICEDDINKKYMIEIYDFDYDSPSTSGSTLYSYSSPNKKQCLSWNPKKNVLAFAGVDDKETQTVHLINPSQTVSSVVSQMLIS